jgi:uncharacterized protein
MATSIITRKTYLNKIKSFVDSNLIKVFVGQRRVGKSYLLQMTRDYISSNYPEANCIFIDKELYEFDFIQDYHTLIQYVDDKIKDETKNYLFIDEIQEIESFEKALRHFQNKQTIDIYCTGSNANMLSGDLATMLSGRYVKIEINTLSYPEFLSFHDLQENNDSLLKYIKWGGLPFIKNLQPSDIVIFDYLKNIVSTILYKDILHRYKVRNVDFFDSLVQFIAANTGNLITAKKISDYLKSQRVDISTKVVLNYLGHLQNAFLVYKLQRVDVNTKKVFEINNKYYFEDWGLRNALLGLHRYSLPDVLENIVFSHLKQLDYSVNIGMVNGEQEIDFVAEKDGKIVYVQVAYLIPDLKVREREFGNLLLVKDNYPKLVVSMDDVPVGEYKGVKHLHIRDFLMEDAF